MKKNKEKESNITVRRDAETGKFVSKDYVEKHPKTTVTEKRSKPKKSR